MFDKSPTQKYPQIGSVKIYDIEKGCTIIDTIPISSFTKCDGVITAVNDTNGNKVIISGFPVILTVKEK